MGKKFMKLIIFAAYKGAPFSTPESVRYRAEDDCFSFPRLRFFKCFYHILGVGYNAGIISHRV
jgi:hypothetical protein